MPRRRLSARSDMALPPCPVAAIAFLGLLFLLRLLQRSPDYFLPAPASHATAAVDAIDANSGVREIAWRIPDAPGERVLSLPRSLLTSPAMGRIRVLPRRRALFCPIRGVASRSLLRALERLEGVGLDGLPRLSDYALRDRERLLVRPSVFRFVFVRDPLSRLASAFLAGRASPDLDGVDYRTFMARVRGSPLSKDEREIQPVSFLFFLTFLASQRPGSVWHGFAPQSGLCGLGRLNYSFLGRLERFEADVDALERTLGPVRPLDPPVFESNASREVGRMFDTHKRRAKAAKLVGDDSRLLGYKPPL